MTVGSRAVRRVGAAGAVADPLGRSGADERRLAGADPGAGPATSSASSRCSAGIRSAWPRKVIEPGIALRIDRDDLFDVLGERPELLRQMFAAMFRRAAGPSFASGVFRPKATQSSVIDPRQVGV